MARAAGSLPQSHTSASSISSKRAKIPVVLLDAAYGLGFQAIPALAHTARYDVLALSLIEDRPIFRRSLHCRYRYEPSWSWERGSSQLAAHEIPGAILFPVSQAAVTWVSRHHTELAQSWFLPPLNRFETLRIASDKATLADFARSVGLDAPRTATLPCTPQVLDDLRYPILLKPRASAGGRGIRRFETRTSLAARLLALTPQEQADHYLQEWVEGEDLSSGVFCRRGEIQSEVTYGCVARDSTYGAFKIIRSVQDLEISRAALALMRALDWNGVANIDFRRSPDGHLYVLELNPRLWGNTLGALCWGLNFPDMICRAALGEEPLPQPRPQGIYFGTTECLALLPEFFSLPRAARTRPLRALQHSSLRFVLRDPLAHWMIFRQNRNETAWTSLRGLFHREVQWN